MRVIIMSICEGKFVHYLSLQILSIFCWNFQIKCDCEMFIRIYTAVYQESFCMLRGVNYLSQNVFFYVLIFVKLYLPKPAKCHTLYIKWRLKIRLQASFFLDFRWPCHLLSPHTLKNIQGKPPEWDLSVRAKWLQLIFRKCSWTIRDSKISWMIQDRFRKIVFLIEPEWWVEFILNLINYYQIFPQFRF